MIPAHLVLAGTERHGVSLLAGQLAAATGAEVVTDLATAAERPRVHVHATDRLLGADPARAAAALVDLARRTRLSLTLHDVPQGSDGAGFERRRDCYAAWLATGADWAVSSRTEQETVRQHCGPPGPGVVVPLPAWAPEPGLPPLPAGPVPAGEASIGVFGWIYPGKGHDDALGAAALLGDTTDTRPRVLAVGAVAAGHADLAGRLHDRAAALGVRLEITGWLADEEVARRLAGVTVGLAGHVNVSASGSINSWAAAGRRPLVRDSAYVREVAALRPGSLEPYPADAGAGELARVIERRLADPGLGALPTGVDLGPTLSDVALSYRRWWSR